MKVLAVAGLIAAACWVVLVGEYVWLLRTGEHPAR